MSLRPPSTYWIRVTGTGAGGSSDPSNFTLAASGDTTVKGAIGSTLRLQGILFETSANGLTFASTPSDIPAGVTLSPTYIAETIAAPCFMEKLPTTINAATVAFPFQLIYGPLGPGGR